ncbi:MAG: putative rane protein [Mucilaginibacter sp.]|nr:putative rane protein [Mucilaginibacter sp.]
MVMKLKISHPVWQVLGLGVLAGMRSTSAPVITSHILSHHHSKNLEQSPLNFMQSVNVSKVLKVVALSELVLDKLPSAPNRIKPAVITSRCLSGALAGASIFKASGGKVLTGAVLGAVAAFASTYGSYYLRKSTVKKTKLFDPIIGAIEDALVIGAGVGLTRVS